MMTMRKITTILIITMRTMTMIRTIREERMKNTLAKFLEASRYKKFKCVLVGTAHIKRRVYHSN